LREPALGGIWMERSYSSKAFNAPIYS
jgi:hypothetical protein